MLVDDDPLVRTGLRFLLDSTDDLTVVAEAGDGDEAVSTQQTTPVDVVLMDLSMPVMDGVEATHTILRSAPETAVVILTTFAEPEQVLRSLDAGAVGYLMKDADPQTLADGIRAAAAGGSPIDARVARTVLEARRPSSVPEASDLTVKQREVLLLVAEGLPNRLVAKRLGVSEKTVKAHLTQIYASLGVTDRVQAALWARDHRMLR